MGTLGGGNGDGWPPDGGAPDGLPELPPEWGVIVIPDDAAELDEDAATIRQELRHDLRRCRWRRRLHLPPVSRAAGHTTTGTIGVPLLIVSIAVLATLASLSAVTWPIHPRLVIGPSGSATATSARPGAAQPGRAVLPDAMLMAGTGAPLRLRDTLPGVILLVDGCACAELIAASAVAGAQAGLGVVAVGRSTPPALPASLPPGARAWTAVDPQGVLWALVSGMVGSSGKATEPGGETWAGAVLLVDAKSTVVRMLPAVASVDQFRADLATLH